MAVFSFSHIHKHIIIGILPPPTLPPANPVTPPSSSSLISVAAALAILSILLFLLGIALGVLGYHLWLKRQKKKDAYIIEKQAILESGVIKATEEGEVNAAVPNGDEENDNQLVESVNIDLFENEAYSMIPTSVIKKTTEDPKENLYISDSMDGEDQPNKIKLINNEAYGSIANHSKNGEGGPGDEFYTDIANPVDNPEELEMGVTGGETTDDEYTTITSQRNEQIDQAETDFAGEENDTREEVYTTITSPGVEAADREQTESDADGNAYASNPARVNQDGIHLADNIAYAKHADRETNNHYGVLIAIDSSSDSISAISTSSQKHGHRRHTDHMEINLADNAAYIDGNLGRGEISVEDNIAYFSHRNGESFFGAKDEQSDVSVEDNLAYVSHRKGDAELAENDDYLYIGEDEAGREISVENNVGYLSHREKHSDSGEPADSEFDNGAYPVKSGERSSLQDSKVRNRINGNCSKPPLARKPIPKPRFAFTADNTAHASNKAKTHKEVHLTNGANVSNEEGDIGVADNIAYRAHGARSKSSSPSTADLTSNTAYHPRRVAVRDHNIRVSENIAYSTHIINRADDDLATNGAYVSNMTHGFAEMGSVGLERNMAYITHASKGTVGAEGEDEDYI